MPFGFGVLRRQNHFNFRRASEGACRSAIKLGSPHRRIIRRSHREPRSERLFDIRNRERRRCSCVPLRGDRVSDRRPIAFELARHLRAGRSTEFPCELPVAALHGPGRQPQRKRTHRGKRLV